MQLGDEGERSRREDDVVPGRDELDALRHRPDAHAVN
jgi:hypothetical protein